MGHAHGRPFMIRPSAAEGMDAFIGELSRPLASPLQSWPSGLRSGSPSRLDAPPSVLPPAASSYLDAGNAPGRRHLAVQQVDVRRPCIDPVKSCSGVNLERNDT
jgi:hypothetical protein